MDPLTGQNNQQGGELKKCPFCAEMIQKEAIFCRFCRKELVAPDKSKKWYNSTPIIVIAILSFGPLALPLVWGNPRYSLSLKFIISIATIALTVALCYVMGAMYKMVMDQMRML